jgi:hypothetical protein
MATIFNNDHEDENANDLLTWFEDPSFLDMYTPFYMLTRNCLFDRRLEGFLTQLFADYVRVQQKMP